MGRSALRSARVRTTNSVSQETSASMEHEAGCAADDDCTEDMALRYCGESRCRACVTDEHCFGASTCDPATFTCAEPAECTDSRECTGDRICASGSQRRSSIVIIPIYPVIWYICTEAGECIIDPDGACETDADCPVIGHVCRQSSRPSRCGPCEGDEDCGDGQTCVAQRDGNVCQSQTCVPRTTSV